MKNKITTDDLINQYFTPEEAQQLRKEVKEEVEKIKWGGKRPNAGRKTQTGTVLKLCIKVSEKEKEFLKYARSHNVDYDKIMQG
jgi:hypothetical protein